MSLLETGNESMCYPTRVAVSRFGVDPGQYRFSDLTDHQRRRMASPADAAGTARFFQPVTDAGVAHLASLTNLRELNIIDTQITATGVAALNKALPKCMIER